MFEGEKTAVFYAGIFIFGGALVGLFATLWFIFAFDYGYAWRYLTPFAFGSAVFVVIGFYLMKFGVTKPLPTPQSKS